MIKTSILVLLMILAHGNAQCNICSNYNVACVSSTQYQYCVYGVGTLVGPVFRCGAGQICSSLANPPSLPCINETTQPDCTCGWCDPGLKYACVSNTQLQLCLNGSSLSLPIITCPEGTVCDSTFSSGGYCDAASNSASNCSNTVVVTTTVAPITTTRAPTTTTRASTTTTRAPTTTTRAPTTTSSPSFSCTEEGRFTLPGTKCRSYAICAFVNNNWVAYNYTCQLGNYFNPATKRCSNNYTCNTN